MAGVSAEVVGVDWRAELSRKDADHTPRTQRPGILQISSYWKPAQTITLDLAPERELTAPLRDAKARRDLSSAKAAFRSALPNRFAERWLDVYAPQGWTNHALNGLERRAH